MDLKLEEEDLKKISLMAGYGMSLDDIAAIIGLNPAYLKRAARTERVSNFINKGKAQTALAVKKAAYDMAISEKHPSITKFWLINQEKWKDHNSLKEIHDTHANQKQLSLIKK